MVRPQLAFLLAALALLALPALGWGQTITPPPGCPTSGCTFTGTVTTPDGGSLSSSGVTTAAVNVTGSTCPANGLYLNAANTVGMCYNGTNNMLWSVAGVGIGGALYNYSGTSFQLINGTPTGTAPDFIPNRSDGKAGIGAYAAGGVSITCDIAGTATECGRFDTSGHVTFSGLATGTGSYVCATAGLLTVEATACPASTLAAKNPLGFIDPAIALQRLTALRPAFYTYKDGKGAPGEHAGLYAQDVAKMDERCASYDAKHTLQNYDPNCVIAYQTAAIEAQQAEHVGDLAAIRALTARVERLERKGGK
jgi:endosialidase-like protein